MIWQHQQEKKNRNKQTKKKLQPPNVLGLLLHEALVVPTQSKHASGFSHKTYGSIQKVWLSPPFPTGEESRRDAVCVV